MYASRLVQVIVVALVVGLSPGLASNAYAAGDVAPNLLPTPSGQESLTLRPKDPALDMIPLKFRSQQPPPEKVTYTAYDVEAYERHIQALIQAQRFDYVEQLFAEFADGTTRTTDGRPMLGRFVTALAHFIQEPDDYSGTKLLAAWEARYPDSTLRRIAAVVLKTRAAWGSRGVTFAHKVSPEGWAGYTQGMAEADAILNENKALWGTSPLWYFYKIAVVAQIGTPQDADAIFVDATQRFPRYLPLYAVRLDFLTPRWGGSYERVDAFIRAATAALRATEGESTYARLYVSVAQTASPGTQFFRDTMVSWPPMKTAFDDLIKRYPDNWNREIYIGFACAARDRPTTADLLRELGPSTNIWTLGLGITTDSCRRFAFTPS